MQIRNDHSTSVTLTLIRKRLTFTIDSVYLAGKITQTTWRDEIAPGWSFKNHSPFPYYFGDFSNDDPTASEWHLAESVIDVGDWAKLDMTGPLWIDVDGRGGGHATSYENPGTHGNTDTCQHGTDTSDVACVMKRIRRAIQSADLFFAWIDSDSCYGTLIEIGYAAAIGKPVVVAMSPEMHDNPDFWLAREMADVTIPALSPGSAWDTLCNRSFSRST